jgi:membrane protein
LLRFLIHFLKLTWRYVRDGDIRTLVYALSFVTLFSLIPFLVITLGLFKWSGFLSFLYPKAKALILAHFSGAVGDGIIKPFEALLKRSYSGSLGLINFIFLILTIITLTDYLERAFNRIWHVKNGRNFLNKLITHWLIIF